MNKTNYIARQELNNELNGVEIYFSVYPISGTKANLKKYGFRWNRKKSCWYAKQNLETLAFATICAETTISDYEAIAASKGEAVTEIKTNEPAKKVVKNSKKASEPNKYGVKVGDFFSMAWGWEQTNYTFFQVIALVGKTSVRVREVQPEMLNSDVVGFMAENRTYNLDTSVILPPSSNTCFIKDQEHGDVKRLKSYAADGISNPQFNVASYADAHLEHEPICTAHETFYA